MILLSLSFSKHYLIFKASINNFNKKKLKILEYSKYKLQKFSNISMLKFLNFGAGILWSV